MMHNVNIYCIILKCMLILCFLGGINWLVFMQKPFLQNMSTEFLTNYIWRMKKQNRSGAKSNENSSHSIFMAYWLFRRALFQSVVNTNDTTERHTYTHTFSRDRSCCFCLSSRAWLWLCRDSLSSSILSTLSFSRFRSLSRSLMAASWVIWVACRLLIWPMTEQSRQTWEECGERVKCHLHIVILGGFLLMC